MALFDRGIFDSGIFDTGAAVHALGSVTLAATGRATAVAGDLSLEVGLGSVSVGAVGRSTLDGGVATQQVVDLGDVALAAVGRAEVAGSLVAGTLVGLGDATLASVGHAALAGGLAAGQDVEFSLGAVSLGAVALAGVTAEIEALGEEADDPFYGTGGPDDPSLPGHVRRWIREKYKRTPAQEEQTQGSQAERQLAHNQPIAGSTPAPATIEVLPALDTADVVAEAREAAKAAIERAAEIKETREQEAMTARRNRQAVAVLLALLDED